MSSTFTSVQSGDWNEPNTWGYTGASDAGFNCPGAKDNATISGGHTVKLLSNTSTSGTLTLNASSTLNLSNFNISVGALSANNATGTAAFVHNSSGTITVDGSLSTTAGGVLDMATNSMDGALTSVTNNGSIKTQSMASPPLPSGKTWGGLVEYNATAGAQTVAGGTYNDLKLSNTSNAQTANGNVTVNSTLTTTAGGTFALDSYQLLGTLATINNSGTIQTKNTSATPLPSGKTWGGTIEFNGNAGQSCAAGSFNNLSINNSAGVTLLADVAVSGVLDFAAGTLATGSHTLTVGCTGSITNASSSKYVDGKLARVYCAIGTKDFPIGKGGISRPITIAYTALTGTSTVVAEQIESTIPGSIPANITMQTDRYWAISQSGGSGFAFDITLDGGAFATRNRPIVLKGDGATNSYLSATYSDPHFSVSGQTSYGNFCIGRLTYAFKPCLITNMNLIGK